MEAETPKDIPEGAEMDELEGLQKGVSFDALSTQVLRANASRVEQTWARTADAEEKLSSGLASISFTGDQLGSTKEIDLSDMVSTSSGKVIIKGIRVLSASNSCKHPVALSLHGDAMDKYPGTCTIALPKNQRGEGGDNVLYVATSGNTQGPVGVYTKSGAATSTMWRRYRQLMAMTDPFKHGKELDQTDIVQYTSPTSLSMPMRNAVAMAQGLSAAPAEVSEADGDILAALMWSNRRAFREPVTASRKKAYSVQMDGSGGAAPELAPQSKSLVTLEIARKDWKRLEATVREKVIGPLETQMANLRTEEGSRVAFVANAVGGSVEATDHFQALLEFEFEHV